MTRREVTVHALCSAKGGVGKSTLAVVLATERALRRGSSVLIDLDLTGTSLADGLDLRAPLLDERDDGTLDIEAEPTGDLCDLDETAKRRRRRHRERSAEPRHVPFFNDALNFVPSDDEHECRLDALLWRHAVDHGVGYLPSSSAPADVDRALEWLSDPELQDAAASRLGWLLDGLVRALPDLTDIVIDLPPGLFGFTRQAMLLMATLSGHRQAPGDPSVLPPPAVRWRAAPYLVLTTDRNDWTVSLHAYSALRRQLPELAPVVNRLLVPRGQFEAKLLGWFGPTGVASELTYVEDLHSELGTLFWSGGLELPADRVGEIAQCVRGGAP